MGPGCAQSVCRVPLFVTPWSTVCWALSMGFPRQDYWGGLPFPPPVDLPNPGTELTSLSFPVLAGRFFTTDPSKKPRAWLDLFIKYLLNISLYEPVCCLNPFGKSLPATCKNNSRSKITHIYLNHLKFFLITLFFSWNSELIQGKPVSVIFVSTHNKPCQVIDT